MKKILHVRDKRGKESMFELEIYTEAGKDFWTAELAEHSVDNSTFDENKSVAPKFYGLNQEQAERRMIIAVESDYEIIDQELVEP